MARLASSHLPSIEHARSLRAADHSPEVARVAGDPEHATLAVPELLRGHGQLRHARLRHVHQHALATADQHISGLSPWDLPAIVGDRRT